jgi:hypothetical protein
MPHVQHLVTGERIVTEIAQIGRPLAQLHDAILRLLQVCGSHHRIDARQIHCGPGIQGADTGMRVRAAQNLAVQHAGQLDVGAKKGASSGLVSGVVASWAGADDAELVAVCHIRAHLASSWLSPASASAADWTARTILS